MPQPSTHDFYQDSSPYFLFWFKSTFFSFRKKYVSILGTGKYLEEKDRCLNFKVKFNPGIDHKCPEGEEMYSSTLSRTSAL
jgi:hypothetical protein